MVHGRLSLVLGLHDLWYILSAVALSTTIPAAVAAAALAANAITTARATTVAATAIATAVATAVVPALSTAARFSADVVVATTYLARTKQYIITEHDLIAAAFSVPRAAAGASAPISGARRGRFHQRARPWTCSTGSAGHGSGNRHSARSRRCECGRERGCQRRHKCRHVHSGERGR